jgi:hypothetical protein
MQSSILNEPESGGNVLHPRIMGPCPPGDATRILSLQEAGNAVHHEPNDVARWGKSMIMLAYNL